MDIQKFKQLAQATQPPITEPTIDRDELGPFVDGYIESAFFCNEFDFYDKWDIEWPTLVSMMNECLYFYWRNRVLLENIWLFDEYDEAQAGRDLWFSRNTHGTGFFDRGKDPKWNVLQWSAVGCGPRDLYVTDKGTIAYEFKYEYEFKFHDPRIILKNWGKDWGTLYET